MQRPKRARIHRGAFFLLIGLLGACATPQQTLELRGNPPNIPASRELVNTPFYPQTQYHCGPAALASIFKLHGIAVDPDEIADKVYTPGLKGSLQIEMDAASRLYGLLPVGLNGRLESILREINAGNPVLVMQNLGLDRIPFWHYAIVVGYDLEAHTLVLRSGTERRLVRPFDNFERTWQRSAHWARVIVPVDRIPATASAEAYLEALIALEQTGNLHNAMQGYRTAISRWADNIVAYMGLGNSAFALGRYDESADAYRSLLKRSPQTAEAWNNLAYALASQGNQPAALDAINKAIELSPQNTNFQHSLVEIKRMLNLQ